MEKVLLIDTSKSQETIVGFRINGQKHFLKGKSKILKAQNVLPLIEKILKKNKLKPGDLTEIKVNPGPGSFTGLRVGIAVANSLGWLLEIPVNGKIGRLAEPIYEGGCQAGTLGGCARVCKGCKLCSLTGCS